MAKKKKHKKDVVSVPYEPMPHELSVDLSLAQNDELSDRVSLLEKTIVTQAIEIRRLTELLEYRANELTYETIYRHHGQDFHSTVGGVP